MSTLLALDSIKETTVCFTSNKSHAFNARGLPKWWEETVLHQSTCVSSYLLEAQDVETGGILLKLR
jgi:hypothetical protein